MKKTLFSILFVMFGLVAMGQDPIIKSDQMPNAVNFLPAPPEKGSAAFDYDQAQYRWGMEQRENKERRAVAESDAVWSVENICKIFSEVMDIKISPEATPAIYNMLAIGCMTADQAGHLPKDHYMRTRPYVFYGEPTIVPGDEEELSHNGSYPSGHTILGWSAALLLTELAPELADKILAVGYRYGESRVIAGFHWQSDVDAGRLVASVAVARLHAEKEFLLLMEKARTEYEKLKR
jgi:acid phosphatase (class A)